MGLLFIKEFFDVLEHDFIKKMREQNGCSADVSQHWIGFAKEIVDMGQFLDFKPVPKETGVQDWLSSIYAACYFAKRRGGNEVIQAIYKTVTIPHCLYPREIIGAIRYIKETGNLEPLVEPSLSGALEYDGRLPVLSDVEHDLKKQRKENRDVR